MEKEEGTKEKTEVRRESGEEWKAKEGGKKERKKGRDEGGMCYKFVVVLALLSAFLILLPLLCTFLSPTAPAEQMTPPAPAPTPVSL